MNTGGSKTSSTRSMAAFSSSSSTRDDDGLDSLIKELKPASKPLPSTASTSARALLSVAPTVVSSKHNASEESWDDWEDEHQSTAANTPAGRPIDEDRIRFYENEIRGYILDIADPSILQGIDQCLHAKTYRGMAEYYLTRPKLATYTIESEVSRMKYKIMYDGAVLAQENPVDVRRVYDEHSDAMIWKFANQSIFADILQELQLRFIRADLDIGVISRDSEFTLNLADDSMVANSQFHVLIAAGGSMELVAHEPSQAQKGGAVELATVLGTVALSVSEEKLVHSVKLTGLKVVFDEVIHAVGEALAYNEERRRGSPYPEEPLVRAPLGALRDQVMAAAGGKLRAVGQASRGLFQGSLQAVTNIATMIEATALEDDQQLIGQNYQQAACGNEGEDGDGWDYEPEQEEADCSSNLNKTGTKVEGGQQQQQQAQISGGKSDAYVQVAALSYAEATVTAAGGNRPSSSLNNTRTRPIRGRPARGGKRSTASSSSSSSSSPFLRLDASAVVKEVGNQSEGLMTGIVGGIGALVGAEGANGRSSSLASASSLTTAQQGSSFKLYRKDGEIDEEEVPPVLSRGSSNSGRSLFDRLGDVGRSGLTASNEVEKGAIDKEAIHQKGPLPAPPSTLLRGFFSGAVDLIASTVEKVIADDDEDEVVDSKSKGEGEPFRFYRK